MKIEPEIHPTTIAFVQSPPAQFPAGAELVLEVQVSCPHGCNLQGRKVRILDRDGLQLAEAELEKFFGAGNTTGDLKTENARRARRGRLAGLLPFFGRGKYPARRKLRSVFPFRFSPTRRALPFGTPLPRRSWERRFLSRSGLNAPQDVILRERKLKSGTRKEKL